MSRPEQVRWKRRVQQGLASTRRYFIEQRLAVLAMSAGAVFAVLLWLVIRPVTPENVELRSLELQRLTLESLLAGDVRDGTSGTLPPGGIVISIREELIGRILEQVLPYEHIFGETLALRLERATVSFKEGLAAIELHGQARTPDSEESFAGLTVVGALTIDDLNENREGLVTRAEVLGFRFDEPESGTIAPTLLRGSQRVATEIVQEVSRFLGQVEIPIRLTTGLSIPEVDSDDLSIAGVDLPVGLEIRNVWVLNGRLFVSLEATLPSLVSSAPDSSQSDTVTTPSEGRP